VSLLDGFFQDEQLFATASCNDYPLQENLLEPARQWMAHNVTSHGWNPYFLHIRRGDYVRWPTSASPAVLPFQWCKRQMDEIVSADERAHFIVCSDDIPYAEEWVGSDPRVSLFKGSEIQDFFLMTQCSGGGILSASTFSWWAAWYGRQFYPNARYLAPRYWAGWRQGEWFPATIETSWLEYSDVFSV
jgi:hypothetical protein